MKKYIIAAFLGAALAGAAEGQTSTRQTFTAPVGPEERERNVRREPPVRAAREAGAIPRAARGGNPAQMVNPMAPRHYYGPPEDTVTYDQNNPSRVTGIILFGLRW